MQHIFHSLSTLRLPAVIKYVLIALPMTSVLAAGNAALIPGFAELVEVRKIWDQAPHNAFTDLVHHKGQWWCVFREGQGHVSPHGAMRVITSTDGAKWESAALLTSRTADLRDPKLTIAPDGSFMLNGAGAWLEGRARVHQSYTWFSPDGRHWSEPTPVADKNYWLWRVSWNSLPPADAERAGVGGVCYGIAYSCSKLENIRLYRSSDGNNFELWADKLQQTNQPNEASIIFLPDNTALCLLRREKANALVGQAQPPYRHWEWKDAGVRVGGPQLLRLPDGRIIAAIRLYQPKARTALCWVDPGQGRLQECLSLPSGGDTSYPGLAWREGLLWVSYYSSHQGKTAIYLAKVKLPSQQVGRAVPSAPQGLSITVTNGALGTVRPTYPELMCAREEPVSRQIEIFENDKPVLRYNYQTVEPGEILEKVTPGNRIYARARSDYIHPLFGPNGEVLTRDWSLDHPHHRGVYWAWPEVDFARQRGDLHALQKVFARPTGQIKLQSGAEFAEIEAENNWLWEDRAPIVREVATIRAYRATPQGRAIDLTLEFLALQEGVTIARRGTDKYGGLNVRLATPASQEIVASTSPSNAAPRRAWSDLTGRFGESLAGLTVFQHAQNPDYPGDWIQFPELSWCQPAFPGSGKRYALSREKPFILRYRLWIHSGKRGAEEDLAEKWDAFNRQ